MNAIVLRNVGKSFKKRSVRREYTSFKTEFVRWITRKRKATQTTHIEALTGLNLEIPRGKTVGIIGRNGSGKSTLLKLVTGIYRPTSGTIEVNGRISALLDLGAGFHPDFSGRENILINGIILGMSRDEVLERMPEIIEFSELGDFIDEPVRTYSSGMFMRLAFAVATHVEPEILIVDEILAVGDEHFSRKSRAKMEEFKTKGKTILLVTHDLGTLQSWCDLGVWIDGGRIRQVGDPHLVVDAYKKAVALAEQQQLDAGESALNAPGRALPELEAASRPVHGPVDAPPAQRWGTFAGEISAVRLLDSSGAVKATFDPEARLRLEVSLVAKEPLVDVGVRVGIRQKAGADVYAVSTFDDEFAFPSPLVGCAELSFSVTRLGLLSGDYEVDVALITRAGVELDVQRGLTSFTVQSRPGETGVTRLAHRWEVHTPSENDDAGVARTGSHG